MVNIKQAGKRRPKMAERAELQRTEIFPEVPKEALWNRRSNDGYITIPRTLPIVMEIIDALTKSQPAGHTYFGLWCRSPDHPMLVVDNQMVLATEAGFGGERAVDTWRRRMKALASLGFIVAKPGRFGDFNYVLIVNPNMVVERLRSEGSVQTETYRKFLDRMTEIGASSEIMAARERMAALQPAPNQ